MIRKVWVIMMSIGLSPPRKRNFTWLLSAADSTSWYLSVRTVTENSNHIPYWMVFLPMSCFPFAKIVSRIYGLVRRMEFVSSSPLKNVLKVMTSVVSLSLYALVKPLRPWQLKEACFSVPAAESLYLILTLFVRAAISRLSYSPNWQWLMRTLPPAATHCWKWILTTLINWFFRIKRIFSPFISRHSIIPIRKIYSMLIFSTDLKNSGPLPINSVAWLIQIFRKESMCFASVLLIAMVCGWITNVSWILSFCLLSGKRR